MDRNLIGRDDWYERACAITEHDAKRQKRFVLLVLAIITVVGMTVVLLVAAVTFGLPLALLIGMFKGLKWILLP